MSLLSQWRYATGASAEVPIVQPGIGANFRRIASGLPPIIDPHKAHGGTARRIVKAGAAVFIGWAGGGALAAAGAEAGAAAGFAAPAAETASVIYPVAETATFDLGGFVLKGAELYQQQRASEKANDLVAAQTRAISDAQAKREADRYAAEQAAAAARVNAAFPLSFSSMLGGTGQTVARPGESASMLPLYLTLGAAAVVALVIVLAKG